MVFARLWYMYIQKIFKITIPNNLTFLTLDHLNVPGTNNGISSFLYVLNCTELYCTILYCTVLYCTAFRGTYARVRVCSCAVLYCYCAVNTAYFLNIQILFKLKNRSFGGKNNSSLSTLVKFRHIPGILHCTS